MLWFRGPALSIHRSSFPAALFVATNVLLQLWLHLKSIPDGPLIVLSTQLRVILCHCCYGLMLTTYKTLWFVGMFLLWRSKEFVSKKWEEEKTRLTTVDFSPTKSNAWSSMTIHKVWQPRVRGWRVKFQCLLLVFKNLQMTITVHLIKWRGGTNIQAFDKGPAVHVSLAVIYMTGGKQGESLNCWTGAADFKHYPSAMLLTL